jgi:hypothetical protein
VLLTSRSIGESGLFDMPGSPLIVRMVAYVSAIFLLPSIMLGFISPMVIKLTLNNLSNAGSTIGRIYAASAIGSIVGTFATGFYLISWFGTRSILLGCGLFLIALGVLLGDWFRSKKPQMMASALLLGAIPVVPQSGYFYKGPCIYETDYFCIRVRDEQHEGTDYRILLLDRLVHSYTAPDSPTKLRYGYEMASAELIEYTVQRDGNVSAYFIGAGGYTLPKYIEHKYPGKFRVDVAEIDPVVTRVGHEYMGLARDTTVRSFPFDARLHLKTMSAGEKYSLVFGDAFNDFSVPYHLTTKEFNDTVKSHLTPEGIYVLNIIDGGEMPFLGAFIRTLKQSFPHVVLVPNGKWLNIPRNTYVVLASNTPIDIPKLRSIDAGDSWPNIDQWIVTEEEMNTVAANNTFLLTDNYVPADILLLPMFEASEAKK